MRSSDWSSDVCSSDLDEQLLRSQGSLPAQTGKASAARHQGAGSMTDNTKQDRKRDAVLAELHEMLPGATASDVTAFADTHPQYLAAIGRSSCRERVCQYV